MQNFIRGQRWISDTESELGLGTIAKVEGRNISVIFPASGERRLYAAHNAPLTRVKFVKGDKIPSQEEWTLTVESVREDDGLISYIGTNENGEPAELSEAALSSLIQFSRPHDRLLTGQTDKNRWFELRHQTLINKKKLQLSPVRGLVGARMDLIKHQLYIAHEVTSRQAPRVLLADEVGLGKTIEAALILHQQLISGRAKRALILVPEPLLHQWLVELLRRFNLKFSLFDEERCLAIIESGQADNPFISEQLVLTSLDLFKQNPKRHTEALNGDWDIMIVDEAHHLSWQEDKPSIDYQIVEQLATITPSVLLLTATPEQLGEAGHFARLRLLDPDRFHDLQQFHDEEKVYQTVADSIEQLLNKGDLTQTTPEFLAMLDKDETLLLEQINNPAIDKETRETSCQQLIKQLLDRHGTGRVLFRNTRARIQGFPARHLVNHPLPLPEAYAALESSSPADLLMPEHAFQAENPEMEWWSFDPRVDWLIDKIRELHDEKILLICAHAETAQTLGEALRRREAIQAALFHEGLTIIERDRAAAWFADMEDGVNLLICSEIGSEGRNFQFSHNLVLFDLPLNPDLLEQRIGRLDRIGQKHEIQIHVPNMAGAQQTLTRWYHEGLNAFEQTCPGGQTIFSCLKPALTQALEESDKEIEAQNALILSTRKLLDETNETLSKGRDHLLEFNSCREPQASLLQADIHTIDGDRELEQYMTRLFAAYGVEQERNDDVSFIIHPGEQMLNDSFPHLPADGLTLTYHRATALSFEDWQFLSWEHPMVSDSMSMLLDSEKGNSAAVQIKSNALPAGTMLLECLFLLECIAPPELMAGRFLPTTMIRVLLDQKGVDRSAEMPHLEINDGCRRIEQAVIAQIVRQYKQGIRAMVNHSEKLANRGVPEMIEQCMSTMMESYTEEIQRLSALQKVNPNVRVEEIEMLQAEGMALHSRLKKSQLKLDSVRLIINA
ncbi:MAG: RNA polymerase-associated protein RapA [Candidatus Polarisedimenticolaceae bacterium]|nr:RNA polymerase-associated protein RapA [Candidatus Polarisedimenticolaceae bacterium]